MERKCRLLPRAATVVAADPPTDSFPLGVQHLHQQRLAGGAAGAVLDVQVLLAPGRDHVNLRNNTEQLGELVLRGGLKRVRWKHGYLLNNVWLLLIIIKLL